MSVLSDFINVSYIKIGIITIFILTSLFAFSSIATAISPGIYTLTMTTSGYNYYHWQSVDINNRTASGLHDIGYSWYPLAFAGTNPDRNKIYLITGGPNGGSGHFYSIDTRNGDLNSFGSNPNRASYAIVSKNGNNIYYSTPGVIGGFNTNDSYNIGDMMIPSGSTPNLATGKDENILYVSEPANGYVGVWDMLRKTQIDRINISNPMALMADPDSKYLYVQVAQNPIRITKIRLGDKANMGTYTLSNTSYMRNPKISTDGSRFIFSDNNNMLKLYSTDSFTPATLLGTMHGNVINNFDVDDTWTYAYAVFGDGIDRIDLNTGTVDQKWIPYSLSGVNIVSATYYKDTPKPPVVSFKTDTTLGMASLSVQFIDESTGTPTGWQWDFGDGSINSTQQNPIHVYDSPGIYTVTLTVFNNMGSGSIIKTDNIIVTLNTATPLANFTANVTRGDPSLTVRFMDKSTGSPETWSWDFDDNGIIDSTVQNPTYTFNKEGTYSVNLTVSSEDGTTYHKINDYIFVTSPSRPRLYETWFHSWISTAYWQNVDINNGTQSGFNVLGSSWYGCSPVGADPAKKVIYVLEGGPNGGSGYIKKIYTDNGSVVILSNNPDHASYGVLSRHGDYIYYSTLSTSGSSNLIGGYDVKNNSIIDDIPISPGRSGTMYIATGADDNILYVSEAQCSYVGIWDMSSRTMIDQINVTNPMNIVVDPDSKYLYVQVSQYPVQITKFRLGDNANMGTYTLWGIMYFYCPKISPDGTMLLFSDGTSDKLRLFYTGTLTPVRPLDRLHRNTADSFDTDDTWTYAYAAFLDGVDRINLKTGAVDQKWVTYSLPDGWMQGALFYKDIPYGSKPDLSIASDDITFEKVV